MTKFLKGLNFQFFSKIPNYLFGVLIFPSILISYTLCFVDSAFSHPDLDPDIEKISLQLVDEPDNVDLLLRRGQLYRFNGKLNDSLSDLEHAQLLDRENRQVALEICRVLVGLGRNSEAESRLINYLQGESGSSRVMALVERAHLYAGIGRAKLAIADFSEALTFYPTVELYLARGHLQESLGQLTDAVKGYREGVSQFPQVTILRKKLIRVKIAQGLYPEALILIDQELAEALVKTELYLSRAEVLAMMGQTDGAEIARSHALAEANRVLAKRPSALKRLARAKVYESMGKLEAAKQDLRHSMQVAPGLKEAASLLDKLEAQ